MPSPSATALSPVTQGFETENFGPKEPPFRGLWSQVITIAQPETLLKWHRRLVAKQWSFFARRRKSIGRPPVDAAVEQWVVHMAKDNSGWDYVRIVGALANLGRQVSDQIVGHILRRHRLGIAPERKRQAPGPHSSAATRTGAGPRTVSPPKSGRPAD